MTFLQQQTGGVDAVDQAVVIKGCHDLTVTPTNTALYRTKETGPTGWAEGVAHWWGRDDRRLAAVLSQQPETA